MIRKAGICILVMVVSMHAQQRVDTLSTRQVGPGCMHYRMVIPEIPWAINVLTVDLQNPHIRMQSVKANDLLEGYEGTSSMAYRNSHQGHRVVGAVNGDFYASGGIPINTQVIDGEILKQPYRSSTLGFDGQNHPVISRVTFYGQIFTDSSSYWISAVNATRLSHQMILYNRFMGESTATNQWGSEISLRPLEEWAVNDTLRMVVEQKQSGVGDMTIADGQVVLSGHGNAAAFLTDETEIGDTLRISLRLHPSLPKITQLMGGYPRIVNDGTNYAQSGYYAEGGPSHTFARHPRTAAGFSADSTILYLITVDGRQEISKGMTLP